MNTLKPLALALVLPLAAACAPTPEAAIATPSGAAVVPEPVMNPAEVAGTYTLVAYGGESLPFTVERDRIRNCVQDITEGRLVLTADRAWDYTYVQRDICEGEPREQLKTERVGGTFTIRDGRLFFSEDWGDDGPEGQGSREARNFEVGWMDAGRLLIEPEGIRGIHLVFQR